MSQNIEITSKDNEMSSRKRDSSEDEITLIIEDEEDEEDDDKSEDDDKIEDEGDDEKDSTNIRATSTTNVCSSSSPDDQRVNNEICDKIKNDIGNVTLSIIVFVAITYLLIYVYIHLWDIVSALGTAISLIFNIIRTCLFYYTMYAVRGLAIIMTGVGEDITKSACTSSWPRINARYITAFNLAQNIDYTSTPGYYDFCTTDSYTVVYTFLIGHLSIIVCFFVVTIFSQSCDYPMHQTYMEMVNRLNGMTSSHPSSSSSASYTYLNSRRLKPYELSGLCVFSSVYCTVVYIILSLSNYLLRNFVKGADNIYYINLPVLMVGMFITKLLIPIIALKCTPFDDWRVTDWMNER